MVNVFVRFLVIVLFIPFSVFSQVSENVSGSKWCSQRKSSYKGPLKSAVSMITPKHKYDVLKYSIDANIRQCFLGSYPNSFTGSVLIQFKIDTALNSIDVDAYSGSLVIDNVSINGISFTHTNDILTITLDQVYQPGDTASVLIRYHHQDIDDEAFYANGGFVFTDCEPDKARRWFPCWDKPSDKALLDLTARVPLNVKLGSNGRLQDSLVSGDTLIYHWVSRDPVATYLMVMTAKVNYNLDIVYWVDPSNPGSTPLPIRFYYNNDENPAQMEQIIGDVCTFFSDKFCLHPFEKNGFATLDNEFSWGGMENQSLTSLCPHCWYQSVVVHEFAHQWFGDMITCGTWADIFLNEGFATYLEALWMEHSVDYNAYKDNIDGNANAYFGGNPGWPISQPSWAINTPSAGQLFNYSITYAKGACVLHLLRYVMGDSLFFQGMKSYANDTLNLKYQSALIADFEIHMEQAYGQSLAWFFNEWIYEPNHPVYKNTYSISNMGNGIWKVGFFTKQTQTNTVFFYMPLQLRIRFTDNTDTIVRFMNDLNGQAYSFYFTKQPNQITFDPDNQIVLKEAVTTVGIGENEGLPLGCNLSQGFPNPASDKTTFTCNLPEATEIKMSVYDLTGKTVNDTKSQQLNAGEQNIILSTATLKEGVYICRFELMGYSVSRQIIVTR